MYQFLKSTLGPIVRCVSSPEIVGRMPEAPCIIAANHEAQIDSLVLASVIPQRLTFVAKNEYFTGGAGAQFYGFLCQKTGQIAVDRSGAHSALAALDAAEQVLRRGGIWVIYPEGTRSVDGRLYRGRTGIMRVASRMPQVPIVPVGLRGTRLIDHPGGRGWRRGNVEVLFGEPFTYASLNLGTTSADWRTATDVLMARIQHLSGQEYVDRHPNLPEVAAREANRSQ